MQHIHTKGMTSRTGKGQSRKSQVIAMGTSKLTRLFARARSYHVQIKGKPNAYSVPPSARQGPFTDTWHDIQVIPRTHRRADVPHELGAATNAFNRRESELQALINKHGLEKVQRAINLQTAYAKPAKGANALWRAIKAAILWIIGINP